MKEKQQFVNVHTHFNVVGVLEMWRGNPNVFTFLRILAIEIQMILKNVGNGVAGKLQYNVFYIHSISINSPRKKFFSLLNFLLNSTYTSLKVSQGMFWQQKFKS